MEMINFPFFVVTDRKNAVVVAPEGEEKIEVHPNRTDIRMTVGTNVTTLNGNSLTLKCPSKGKPKPKITWYKDAIEVRQDGEKTSFGQNGELILKFVNSDDAAKYTCVAENKYGRDKMSTVVNVAGMLIDILWNLCGKLCGRFSGKRTHYILYSNCLGFKNTDAVPKDSKHVKHSLLHVLMLLYP